MWNEEAKQNGLLEENADHETLPTLTFSMFRKMLHRLGKKLGLVRTTIVDGIPAALSDQG